MKKIGFYLSLIVATIMIGFTATSCSDDINCGYKDYVVGYWNANFTDVQGNITSENHSYTWTFRSDGTGSKVYNNDGMETERFRYTVEGFGSKSGAWYDFAIHFTFLKENGDIYYEDTVYCRKSGGKVWNMCTIANASLYKMTKK